MGHADRRRMASREGWVMPQQKLESAVQLAAKAKAVRRDVLLQVYKAQFLVTQHDQFTAKIVQFISSTVLNWLYNRK